MKKLLSLASCLPLAALLFTAQAQSLPKVTTKTVNTPDKAATEHQTAEQRAATYEGPKVVKSTRALGQKMVQKSKPTDMRVPVLPVKR